MAVSPSTSLNLLRRLRAGDPESWRRLNDLYRPLLRAWLRPRGLQPADVDDLTQAALAVVFKRLGEFEHNGRPGAFRTWLRGIIGNVLRDHRRAAGRRPPARLGRRARRRGGRPGQRAVAGVGRRARPVRPPRADGAGPPGLRAGHLGGVPPDRDRRRTDPRRRRRAGMTVNAVRVARTRVLARLRAEAEGFLDDV